jgi:hypothetical protein
MTDMLNVLVRPQNEKSRYGVLTRIFSSVGKMAKTVPKHGIRYAPTLGRSGQSIGRCEVPGLGSAGKWVRQQR